MKKALFILSICISIFGNAQTTTFGSTLTPSPIANGNSVIGGNNVLNHTNSTYGCFLSGWHNTLNPSSGNSHQIHIFGAENIITTTGLSNSFILGYSNSLNKSNSFAIGNTCSVTGANSFAIGNTCGVTQSTAFAIGNNVNSTGVNSIGIGNYSSASGQNSVTIGTFSGASGTSAFSIGNNNASSGVNSTSIGNYATTLSGAQNSVAIGTYCDANAANAFVIGNGTTTSHLIASGIGAFAIGNNNTSSGQDAVTIGKSLSASGSAAFAIGNNNSSIGSNSISIGNYVTTSASAQNSIILGSGLSGNLLSNTTSNSLIISFKNSAFPTLPAANQPTLFVGAPNTYSVTGSWDDNGTVGIGTNDTKGHTLAVRGDIIAEKMQVALYNNWPDYVFTNSYKLTPLNDVEQYIKENSHLPNVPSAEVIETNGYDLADMDATLLKKIEEMTLYLIEMKKENEILKQKINKLETK